MNFFKKMMSFFKKAISFLAHTMFLEIKNLHFLQKLHQMPFPPKILKINARKFLSFIRNCFLCTFLFMKNI